MRSAQCKYKKQSCAKYAGWGGVENLKNLAEVMPINGEHA